MDETVSKIDCVIFQSRLPESISHPYIANGRFLRPELELDLVRELERVTYREKRKE